MIQWYLSRFACRFGWHNITCIGNPFCRRLGR
jgi:hypothetical protein